jgi:hypothetical protein
MQYKDQRETLEILPRERTQVQGEGIPKATASRLRHYAAITVKFKDHWLLFF